LVVVGPVVGDRSSDSPQPARPRPTALLSPRSNGKPEAVTAVVELLMMGMRMPERCWAVFERQAINLRNCCIWLVDSFECNMLLRNVGTHKPIETFICPKHFLHVERGTDRNYLTSYLGRLNFASPRMWQQFACYGHSSAHGLKVQRQNYKTGTSER
jgi:hypothetical protein